MIKLYEKVSEAELPKFENQTRFTRVKGKAMRHHFKFYPRQSRPTWCSWINIYEYYISTVSTFTSDCHCCIHHLVSIGFVLWVFGSNPGVHFSFDVLPSWADHGSCAHKCVCYNFRTVTRNAVNKSVWRKKDCSWLPLNKHAMNIWLSSLRIRAHLSWRTGKHQLQGGGGVGVWGERQLHGLCHL